MSDNGIETRLIYGFLDAGKTTYIKDCIQNDYFCKYGTTLILCFEEGEEAYTPELLSEKKTTVKYYDWNEDLESFCRNSIEECRPDRIYVEMNTMIQGLREAFPDSMRVDFVSTWIDWKTLSLYFANFRQLIMQMVSEANQVTFRGCPSKELLEPYAPAFRLMNQKAAYLRQDPMGYHEKAFDLFLPFSLEDEEIVINEDHYLIFWLDALDHPEHYEGKKLCFRDPLEIRNAEPNGPYSAGRVVMTCCMADLQFMAFELISGADASGGGWITFDAFAHIGSDEYGRKKLKLKAAAIDHVSPPDNLILISSRS